MLRSASGSLHPSATSSQANTSSSLASHFGALRRIVLELQQLSHGGDILEELETFFSTIEKQVSILDLNIEHYSLFIIHCRYLQDRVKLALEGGRIISAHLGMLRQELGEIKLVVQAIPKTIKALSSYIMDSLSDIHRHYSDQYTTKLNEMWKKNTELAETIRSYTNGAKNQELRIEALTEELEAKQIVLKNSLKEREDMFEVVSCLRRTTQTRILHLSGSLQRMRTEQRDLRTSFVAELSKFKQSFTSVMQFALQSDHDAKNLRAKLTVSENENQSLSVTKLQLEDTLQSVKNQFQEFKKLRDQVEEESGSELSSLRQTNTNLTRDKETLTTEVSDQKSTISRLARENGELQEEISRLRSSEEQIRTSKNQACRGLEEEVHALKVNLETLTIKNQELKKENVTVLADFSLLTQERDHQVKKLQAERDEFQSKLEDSIKVQNQTADSMKRATAENQILEEENTKLRTQIDVEKEHSRKLQDKYQEERIRQEKEKDDLILGNKQLMREKEDAQQRCEEEKTKRIAREVAIKQQASRNTLQSKKKQGNLLQLFLSPNMPTDHSKVDSLLLLPEE